ncbi:hypothetical protein ONZ45_g1917 [Pleurotus djamor]|nr:hypothetical protein ONZ45_g1917 [Pleurotus djamor]
MPKTIEPFEFKAPPFNKADNHLFDLHKFYVSIYVRLSKSRPGYVHPPNVVHFLVNMPYVVNKSSNDISVWIAKDSNGYGNDSWFTIPANSVETQGTNYWDRAEKRKVTIKSNGKLAAFDIDPGYYFRVEVSDANIIIYKLVPVGNAVYFP